MCVHFSIPSTTIKHDNSTPTSNFVTIEELRFLFNNVRDNMFFLVFFFFLLSNISIFEIYVYVINKKVNYTLHIIHNLNGRLVDISLPLRHRTVINLFLFLNLLNTFIYLVPVPSVLCS